MESPRKTRIIAEGVAFHSIIDSRFKTNRLTIHFVTQLDEKTVTVNALIPQVLKKGFEGCDHFTELNKRLQSLYGAYLEADVQKRGDYQILTLSIIGIDDCYSLHGEEITKSCAEILCGMILHPIIENNGFRSQYVTLEKKALADTIEAEINEKRSYAVNNMLREMCANEPYGIPKYGFLDQVEHITPQSAKQQYETLLHSARIEIIFTGRGDSKAALSVFEEAFAGLDRQYQQLKPIEVHPLLESERAEPKEKIENMAVSQSKLVLGFAGGPAADAAEVSAVRLMATVLGGTPSSKLFVNVREKMSLCYYCATRYDTNKGIMIVDSGVESQNVEKARSAILAQLNEIKEGGVTEDELHTARLSLENAYSCVYENDSTVESFYLGQILTEQNSTPELECRKLTNVKKEDLVCAAKRFSLDTAYLLTGKGE